MTVTVDRVRETAVSPEPVPLTVDAPAPDTEQPRRINGMRVDDYASLLGSLGGSLAITWMLYENVLLWSGTVGFLVAWWVAFLGLYCAVSAIDNDAPAVRDRLMKAVVHTGALVVLFALVTALGYPILHGYKALLHPNFYTHDMGGVLPDAKLDKGGISHALVGTAIQIGIATAISLPLGLGTAVYLTEVGGRLSSVVRTVVEAMTALPDILAGLFVYALFILIFDWDKTGLAVAIALSVTMTPVVARSAEVVLRVVPGGLRESSLALGASRWRTVWNVVLPTARAGLATSLILGVARVAGETAPLLIVSGSNTFWNDNPTKEPMNSLPFFTFSTVKTGIQGPALDRAYGAALVLLLFVLVLFVIARLIARDKAGKR